MDVWNRMNIEQAKTALSFHSGRNENIKDTRWKNGFLGSLRPFQSMALVETNFHHVMGCLDALSDHIIQSEHLEKELVNNISGIICFGFLWGVHQNSILRRNNLISQEDAKLLSDWIDCISYAWTMLLDSDEKSVAFEVYNLDFKRK